MRIIIKVFIILFVITKVLLLPVVAEAQQCADWICWEKPCKDVSLCPYGGNNQICTCSKVDYCDSIPLPPSCVTCGPGTYVCNSGCCPIDPPSCFLAGTQVLLPDGGTKNIENIEVGDEVISQVEDGIRSISRVKEVETPVRLQMCQLSFENGDVLELTDEHPLLTTAGWKAIEPTHTYKEVPGLPVSTLGTGDSVISNSATATVSAIACRSEQNQTYNLILDGTARTYFANGYLAHNKGEVGSYCGRFSPEKLRIHQECNKKRGGQLRSAPTFYSLLIYSLTSQYSPSAHHSA